MAEKVFWGVVGAMGVMFTAATVNHKVRSTLFGFEGAGVVGLDPTLVLPGDMHTTTHLVAFWGVGKNERILSFPGGKCEIFDLFPAFRLWHDKFSYPIARVTAAREYREETGIFIDPRDLKDHVVTGHGKTTTGMPVVWFTAYVSSPYLYPPRATGEFSSAAVLQRIENPKDFRKFNRASFPAMRNAVNSRVGHNAIPEMEE